MCTSNKNPKLKKAVTHAPVLSSDWLENLVTFVTVMLSRNNFVCLISASAKRRALRCAATRRLSSCIVLAAR
jgi:hypothetical protein